MVALQVAAQRKVAKNPPPKKSAPKPAAKKPYKGKYPGPDKYKGKPPPKKAAPKPVAKAAPKPAATRAIVPVANSTGNLVDPTQWEQDQARLVAAREDQAELLSLNQADDEANIEYQTELTDTNKEYEQQKLDVQRQRDAFAQQKELERADLNSNLSYRGVGSRGSAANRKWGQLSTQQAATESNLTGQQTALSTGHGTALANLEGARNTRLATTAGRRLELAGRGSGKGSYTTGAGTTTDTGVTAPKPVSLKPPPSPYNKTLAPKKPVKKTYKGKYPGPDKYKGKPPPKVVKAAQRKTAKKK